MKVSEPGGHATPDTTLRGKYGRAMSRDEDKARYALVLSVEG
jgi:hypothetical protein